MSSILNCGQKMTFSSYHIGELVDIEEFTDADYAGECALFSPFETASCTLIIKWYKGEGFLVLFRVYDDNNIYSYQTPYNRLVDINTIKTDILARFKSDEDSDGVSIVDSIYNKLLDKTVRDITEVSDV